MGIELDVAMYALKKTQFEGFERALSFLFDLQSNKKY